VERDGQSPVRICFIIKSDREDQAERELIQREPTSAEDIGVAQAPAEETSASPPSINVYAMILDEMTQDQLDEIDDSTIRDAVDRARASARDDNPDLGEVNVAQIAFTRARSALDL
jgi:hypothetical protein